MKRTPVVHNCSPRTVIRPASPAYIGCTNPPCARVPGGGTTPERTMAVEGYCVKCKAKREMKDAKENTMANGRKAMKGTCSKCGTGMFKILGK